MLTAHEVFGHEFRHRSFDEEVMSYQLHYSFFSWLPEAFLIPLTGLGASTRGRFIVARSTIDIRLLVTIASSEANTVLASELIRTHFNSSILDHRTANLFFKAFVDLPTYILNSSEKDSGDIAHYLSKRNYQKAWF